MSEMAQTATQLVVLGRGKLITEASVEDFVDQPPPAAACCPHPGNRAARPLLAAPASP